MIKYKLKTNKIELNIIGISVTLLVIILNSQIIFSQDTITPPPSGFDSYKANIFHGTNQIVSYYSSTVGVTRKTRIYFPPGYTKDSTYNVLYLLHGIGGDISEWYNNGVPHFILDNLYARGRIAPMIVVLPNGRAMKDDSPGSNIYAADKVAGFANFEIELINDLVPFIDSAYPIKPGREARAIAGLSMGAGQALNFGLAHLDTFAWVGAFSPAPNTKAANLLIPDLADTSKISGLWISCGNTDGLFYISQNTHDYLVQNSIKHYFLVEPGKGHDWSVWKPGLYHFAQRIFGRVAQKDTVVSGISKYLNDEEFDISYNPTNQIIRLVGVNAIEKLIIYDMSGRTVLNEFNLKSNTLDISRLNKGVYLIVVFDGKTNFLNKVMKL